MMQTLNDIKALNSALMRRQPLVAVFFGSTGGIGLATIRELAKAAASSGQGLRAYIVARDTKAGEGILTECKELYPNGQFKYIKAKDLSLLKDVDRICVEITQMEEGEGGGNARIDYLMVAQGGTPFTNRIGKPSPR